MSLPGRPSDSAGCAGGDPPQPQPAFVFSVDEEVKLQSALQSCRSDVTFSKGLCARTVIFFDLLRAIALAQIILSVLAILSSAANLSLNSILLWRGPGRRPYTFMDSNSYLITSVVGYVATLLILVNSLRLLLWWWHQLRRGLLRWAIFLSYSLILLLGLTSLALSLAYDYSFSGLGSLLGIGLSFVLEYGMYYLFKSVRVDLLRYLSLVHTREAQQSAQPVQVAVQPPEGQSAPGSGYQEDLAQDIRSRSRSRPTPPPSLIGRVA